MLYNQVRQVVTDLENNQRCISCSNVERVVVITVIIPVIIVVGVDVPVGVEMDVVVDVEVDVVGDVELVALGFVLRGVGVDVSMNVKVDVMDVVDVLTAVLDVLDVVDVLDVEDVVVGVEVVVQEDVILHVV